jgi:hypothetical protein
LVETKACDYFKAKSLKKNNFLNPFFAGKKHVIEEFCLRIVLFF